MPIVITDTQRSLAESIREWAQRSRPLDQVREAEQGASRLGGWSQLADIGLFGIAVTEDLGGAGASIADSAAGLEAASAALAPGPVLPTMLATLLLNTTPDVVVAKEVVPALVSGSARAAVALGQAVPHARRTGDGGLVVNGDAGLVLGADDATVLVLSAAVDDDGQHWFVLPVDADGVELDVHTPLDFSRGLATVTLREVTVPPTALVPGVDSATVRDLAATLAAAEASGIAGWCVHTMSEYARIREQFGTKIGAFQAVKHLCATALCRAEQASALAWDAARALDEGSGQHSFAAAIAASTALDAAVDNAKDCIQVLGGIGFTWEHEAHFYLRRASALRQVLGGSARWRIRAATLALGGARRSIDVDLSEHSDVSDSVREQVRADLTQIAALPADVHRGRLAETGYLMPHWPSPYGRSAGPALQLLIDAELARVGVRRPDLVIGGWASATIMEHGTPEQRERFIMPTLRGEISWCQLFSEPEAGSDLAALRTTAVRAEGGWRMSGQKVWTSLAVEADWAICLARTDPEAPKHKGITYFLVDMRSAGIETRPLREITGDARFNEVFLSKVFVPDECVVGEINGGWRLARTTLANERVAMSGGSTLGESVESLLAAVREQGVGEQVSAETLGRLIADAAACSVLDLRSVLNQLGGHSGGAESSVRKLIGVAHRQEVAEIALEMLGPQGAADTESTRAVQHEFLLSRCLSIAGGTTQVLLNVAAERLLGLPR